MKVEELKKISRNAHKLIEANIAEDANTRWENKPYTDQVVLYDGTTLDNLAHKDELICGLSKDVYKTNDSSFYMEGINDATCKKTRPTLSVSFKFNHLDLSNKNRLTLNIMPISVGYYNFYTHFYLINNGEYFTDAPNLTPNKWNKVVWEIDKVNRNDISDLRVDVFLMGCPPEATKEVKVYIDSITAECVKCDYDLGWELEDRIAYSHVGYFPNQQKTAIISKNPVNTFTLLKNNQEFYQNEIKYVKTSLGEYGILDFSEVTQAGEYILKAGDIESKPFIIDSKPFDSSIWKSMNFLRLLRCGEDIEGVHSACHLNSRTFTEDGRSLPDFGGWHDAGDVSQFEICTAEMAHAILDLAEKVKDSDTDLYERLMEEARVGINWTLRTRFGDGYRALTVLYRVWQPNVVENEEEFRVKNMAENGPFENFISAASLAKAAIMWKDEDPIFSDWCKRAATEDFEFAYDGYKKGIYTKRWGPSIDSVVSGHGSLAACELYLLTKDDKYISVAKEYAKTILACQEQDGIGSEAIKGFFYEDVKHQYVLSYEHRGHENSPIQGLTKLMEVAPNDKEYNSWKKGVELYKSYILSTINDTKPYGLVPGHIYITDKINLNHFTFSPSDGTKEEVLAGLVEQVKQGRKVSENAYVRKMPIAVDRRGFHATLLAKTKAISSCAKVLKDNELKQIVIDQLEWVFGKNPFASSTMYGEGYNYHPLYVAFSPQMVGALPVGIKTKGSLDAPYWPIATQAVYKEIWGHTTGKYLWVLADLD